MDWALSAGDGIGGRGQEAVAQQILSKEAVRRGATLTYVMAISKDLLEILVCPLCKATVEMKPDESGLKCVQCKRVYPIRDDIPVMLVDEARIEE